MLFNVNHDVKVRLTDHGRSILAKEGLSQPREGWAKFKLWELMSIFGPHLCNGCKQPFETQVDIIIPDEPVHSQLAPASIHSQQAPAIEQKWIERRIYRNSPEYKSYIEKRFLDQLSISLEYDGHRWKYQHTSFNDQGDYDVIVRPPCE
ncbi:hypothetical protein UFOVP431_45 [uncultured Caudovirales phage]|uniref:Uncharacterized protein n=1 Tax=uncultured Caudovirales phage TaxID=2100421 RepID=A0A6J5MRD2_9CAUD|nr:hypothetical protein UFOVP431_45 [uncultured Caudovirales phage]